MLICIQMSPSLNRGKIFKKNQAIQKFNQVFKEFFCVPFQSKQYILCLVSLYIRTQDLNVECLCLIPGFNLFSDAKPYSA